MKDSSNNQNKINTLIIQKKEIHHQLLTTNKQSQFLK